MLVFRTELLQYSIFTVEFYTAVSNYSILKSLHIRVLHRCRGHLGVISTCSFLKFSLGRAGEGVSTRRNRVTGGLM